MYVPLQHLLTRLSVSSILLVTRLVLLEQKVLFVGSSVAWSWERGDLPLLIDDDMGLLCCYHGYII